MLDFDKHQDLLFDVEAEITLVGAALQKKDSVLPAVIFTDRRPFLKLTAPVAGKLIPRSILNAVIIEDRV